MFCTAHILLHIIAFAVLSITKHSSGVCAFVRLPTTPYTQYHHNHTPTPSLSLSNSPNHDDEPRTAHKISINLPLGIVLEELDESDPTLGVVVIGINEGNARQHNANILSQAKSTLSTQKNNINECICIRDKIMSVNGTPCHNKGFDDVIHLISSTEPNETVSLEIGRLQDSTVLNYYNVVCISALPGENYGFLANKCGIDIQYECRTGNCQTCMRYLEFPDKMRDIDASNNEEGKVHLYSRTILHCVGKVPRGYQWLKVMEPYYNENDDTQ